MAWGVSVNPVSIPFPSPETELGILWRVLGENLANNHRVVHRPAQP